MKKRQTDMNCVLVQEALQYIGQHAEERITLEKAAAKFYISPKHLSVLIHEKTGVTYRQHIVNSKIDAGKRLLAGTKRSVEDIAHSVGYENYISFYYAFKKRVGMSPTEYRFGND